MNPSITYLEAFQQLQDALSSLYEEEERKIIAHWAMDHLVGTSSLMWSFKKGEELMTSAHLAHFLKMEQQLKEGVPIQYVMGKVSFYGSEFIVNQHVLIPRPETEELIDWIISDAHQNTFPPHAKVVDFGTGSGVIPVILKKMFPDFVVSGYDIDPLTVEVAAQNASLNEVEVVMKVGDILDVPFWDNEVGPLDILISNPPYVLDVEQSEMEQHVLKHEPLHAIFVSNTDPLQFYKALEQIARQQLRPGGVGYFELSALFAEATEAYFKEQGWATELRRDLLGRFRMLKFFKPQKESY